MISQRQLCWAKNGLGNLGEEQTYSMKEKEFMLNQTEIYSSGKFLY